MKIFSSFKELFKGPARLVTLSSFIITVTILYSTVLKVLLQENMDLIHFFYMVLVIFFVLLAQSSRKTLIATLISSFVVLPVTVVAFALALQGKSSVFTNGIIGFYRTLYSLLFPRANEMTLVFLLSSIVIIWLLAALSVKLRAGMFHIGLGSAVMLALYLYCPQGPIEAYVLKQTIYFLVFSLPIAAAGIRDFIPAKASPKAYRRFYSIVAAVMLVTLLANGLFMPQDDDRRSAELLRWYNENIVQSTSSLRNGYNKIFRISTGFKKTDAKKMGGDVAIDHSVKLQVITTSPVYLRGAVFDQYQDNTWSINDGRKLYLYPQDNSVSPAFRRAFGLEEPLLTQYKDTRFLFAQDEVHILSTNTRDTTIFNALYTERINSTQIAKRELKFSSAGECFVSKQVTDAYSFVYDRPLNMAVLMNLGEQDNTVSQELQPYLQLPDTLEPGVTQLAQNITTPGATFYENAKHIEKYLLENYTYTLRPGDVPEGRDFVSYFLLDSKEGYCEYYASAFVILCRLAGIPARYVEGYRVDEVSKASNNNSLLAVSVTGASAHAWTEVYIPDFGWCTFDAVAASDFATNQDLHTATPRVTPKVTPKITPTPTPTTEPFATPSPSPSPTPSPSPSPTPSTPGIWQDIAGGTPYVLGGLLMLALAFLLLLCMRRYRADALLCSSSQPKEKAEALGLYGHVLWLLRCLGHKRPPAQTAYQYISASGAPVKKLAQKLLRKKYTPLNEEALAAAAAVAANILLFAPVYEAAVSEPLQLEYLLLTRLAKKKYTPLLLALLYCLHKKPPEKSGEAGEEEAPGGIE